MPWRMKIHGVAGGETYPRPVYLEAFDLDAHGGRGFSALTADPSKALTWPDLADVLAAWKTVSRVRPTRPDGKPNRPLTAYTIEPERVP